jgi:transcriptional regulator with XRE-family HTH domain
MGIKDKIGLRIKELRIKNKLTQEKLAEMVNIAPKHQSYVETGKNFPSAKLLENYAKVFKISEEELLTINHIKPVNELSKEISKILKNTNDSQKIIIYKFLKALVE